MTDPSFEAFFLASAGVGGAFIGLLFVAISISPRTTFGHMRVPAAPRQQLAEAALVTMANGFIVSSVALIPGLNVGWVALGGGIWGAIAASYLAWRVARYHRNDSRTATWRHTARVVSLSLIAVVIFTIEAGLGMQLLVQEETADALRRLAVTVIALYSLAILRAWILLGDPSEGLSGLLNPLQDRASD